MLTKVKSCLKFTWVKDLKQWNKQRRIKKSLNYYEREWDKKLRGEK